MILDTIGILGTVDTIGILVFSGGKEELLRRLRSGAVGEEGFVQNIYPTFFQQLPLLFSTLLSSITGVILLSIQFVQFGSPVSTFTQTISRLHPILSDIFFFLHHDNSKSSQSNVQYSRWGPFGDGSI